MNATEASDGEVLLRRNAPAKINLGLHVLRRRADGFHDIETIFLRVPWCDVLSARPAPELRITCSDPSLPTDRSNLVLQAAARLTGAYGVEAGAELHLEKHLPAGAGLGGGSSDAAAALRLMAELWALDVSEERLHALATGLGSDVPFFLQSAEAAYATGRGEKLTPLSYRCPFSVVIIAPEVHISTPWAYRQVTPQESGRPDLREVVHSGDLMRYRRELVNDFEEVVFAKHPGIRRLKEQLIAAGAGYAALSGSGSAVYGLFEEAAMAWAAVERLREEGERVWTSVEP